MTDETARLRAENARLTAILYSVMKRHPEAKEWNLELSNVTEDVLPDRVLVGWNVLGNNAIVTVLFGETLRQLDRTKEVEDVTVS